MKLALDWVVAVRGIVSMRERCADSAMIADDVRIGNEEEVEEGTVA